MWSHSITAWVSADEFHFRWLEISVKEIEKATVNFFNDQPSKVKPTFCWIFFQKLFQWKWCIFMIMSNIWWVIFWICLSEKFWFYSSCCSFKSSSLPLWSLGWVQLPKRGRDVWLIVPNSPLVTLEGFHFRWLKYSLYFNHLKWNPPELCYNQSPVIPVCNVNSSNTFDSFIQPST